MTSRAGELSLTRWQVIWISLTILKTSQAIAGEIELDRLLDRLMTSAIENSGAQQGFLLLQEGGQWMIAAQADPDKMEACLRQRTPCRLPKATCYHMVSFTM